MKAVEARFLSKISFSIFRSSACSSSLSSTHGHVDCSSSLSFISLTTVITFSVAWQTFSSPQSISLSVACTGITYPPTRRNTISRKGHCSVSDIVLYSDALGLRRHLRLTQESLLFEIRIYRSIEHATHVY